MEARIVDWRRVRLLLGIPVLLAIPLLWLGGCMWQFQEQDRQSLQEQAQQEETQAQLLPLAYSPTNPYYTDPNQSPFVRDHVGQCTWYVYGRIQEAGISHSDLSSARNRLGGQGIFRGHSNTWHLDAQAAGLQTGTQPRAGAIAVWTPDTTRHVAYVESVNPLFVTESNFKPRLNGEVVVCDTEIVLRESPSSAARQVARAARFALLRVTPDSKGEWQSGDWFRLRTQDGKEGWAERKIHSEFAANFTGIRYANPHAPLLGNPNVYIYLGGIPARPVLSTPKDKATGVPVNPTLSWARASGADVYVIEVATDKDFKNRVLEQTLRETSVVVTDKLTRNTKYWWRVQAKNSNGNSFWSQEWSFTTTNAHNTPSVSSVNQFRAGGSTQIPEGGVTNESTVVFRATVTEPDGDPVKLQIELRRTTEQFTGTPTWESSLVHSGTQVSWTRGGLVDGRYKWRYRAVDKEGLAGSWVEFGRAGNTDFIMDRTPPTEPGNLRVTGSTFSRIDLAWNPSTDNLSGVAVYRIYRDGSLLATVPSNQTSFRDTGVKAGERYCYRVSTVDLAGNESARSNEACARAVPWPR